MDEVKLGRERGSVFVVCAPVGGREREKGFVLICGVAFGDYSRRCRGLGVLSSPLSLVGSTGGV